MAFLDLHEFYSLDWCWVQECRLHPTLQSWLPTLDFEWFECENLQLNIQNSIMSIATWPFHSIDCVSYLCCCSHCHLALVPLTNDPLSNVPATPNCGHWLSIHRVFGDRAKWGNGQLQPVDCSQRQSFYVWKRTRSMLLRIWQWQSRMSIAAHTFLFLMLRFH